MQSDFEVFPIFEEEGGLRLDQVLVNRYKGVCSRSYLQGLIRDARVLLNGKSVKKQIRVASGDQVQIAFVSPPQVSLRPEKIPLDVVYEDEHVIAVNKPSGLVVHPAPGHWSGTLVNALLHHCGTLPPGGPLRPGIVHRIDKGTSGLVIVAKSCDARDRLLEMFVSKKICKTYLAICLGNPGEGTVTAPIGRHPIHRKKMTVRKGGREAITHYTTIGCDKHLSVVRLVIETGRTHQIRVHLKHCLSPVLGDSVYGSSKKNGQYNAIRPYLHAYTLQLSHPIEKTPLTIEAPIPADMSEKMSRILGA